MDTRALAAFFAQMVSIALDLIEHQLEALIETRGADEHWSDADVDVDCAVDLALSHVRRMRDMEFKREPGDRFSWEWWKVAAPINMACKLFSRHDCLYWRQLSGLRDAFAPVHHMVDFTTREAA